MPSSSTPRLLALVSLTAFVIATGCKRYPPPKKLQDGWQRLTTSDGRAMLDVPPGWNAEDPAKSKQRAINVSQQLGRTNVQKIAASNIVGVAMKSAMIDNYHSNVAIEEQFSSPYSADQVGLSAYVEATKRGRSPIQVVSQEIKSLPTGSWLVVETLKSYNDPKRVRTYHAWAYCLPGHPRFCLYFTELEGVTELDSLRDHIANTFRVKP